MKQRGLVYCGCLGLLIVVLFALNLVMGSVSIPVADVFSILTGDKTLKPSRPLRRCSVAVPSPSAD